MDRIFEKLVEKTRASDKLHEPLLGPPGFVCRAFADDLRELPPKLCDRIEEYAWLLEDAVRKRELGRMRRSR